MGCIACAGGAEERKGLRVKEEGGATSRGLVDTVVEVREQLRNREAADPVRNRTGSA